MLNRFLCWIIAACIPKKKNKDNFLRKHSDMSGYELRLAIEELKQQNELIIALLSHITNKGLIPKAKGIQRYIQKLNYEILVEIDRVCRKYQIHYWLDSGTLLGAIRHEGFIPWDDDIDIGMMIDDYIKFKEVVLDEWKDSNFELKIFPSVIGKVMHKEFMPKNDMEWYSFINWQEKEKIFLAVDIFPYYSLKEEISIDFFQERMKWIYKEKQKVMDKIDKNNIKELKKVYDLMEFGQSILKTDGNAARIFMGAETIPKKPYILNRNDIFPLKETVFENHNFYIPNSSEKVLHMYYGDYTELRIYASHRDIKNLSNDEVNRLINLVGG